MDAFAMLVLTSNFPSTPCDAAVDCLRALNANPTVGWIPPITASGRERFPAAQEAFRAIGITRLELCDIDKNADEQQLARLDRHDAIYLTGGNPLAFRQNLMRHGMADRLRAFLSDGRAIVAASGGAMQLTANVSLFRLLTTDVSTVVSDRSDYEALGFVPYELLPHFNTLDQAFVEKVRRYSALIPCDVLALEDGAAVIHRGATESHVGRIVRFRNGVSQLADSNRTQV